MKNFLLDNEFEEKIIKAFKNSCEIKEGDEKYIEGKLREQSCYLELLFVIYYNNNLLFFDKNRNSCQNFDQNLMILLKQFSSQEFGNKNKTLNPLTKKAHSLIQTINAQYLLVTNCMLNLKNENEKEPSIVSDIQDIIDNLKSNEMNFGALFLTYIGFFVTLKNFEELRDSYQLTPILEKGLENNGVKYLKNILDPLSKDYPFHSNEREIEGYKNIVKYLIYNLLHITVLDPKMSFPIDVLEVLTLILTPTSSIPSFIQQKFWEVDTKSNYSLNEYKLFIQKTFADKGVFFKFLSTGCYSNESAEVIFYFVGNYFKHQVEDNTWIMDIEEKLPRDSIPAFYELVSQLVKYKNIQMDSVELYDTKIASSLMKILNSQFQKDVKMGKYQDIFGNLLKNVDKFSQIIRKESSFGQYDFTISFLELIYKISRTRPYEMTDFYKILPFICSNVLASNDSWRYNNIRDRWTICVLCLKIFNDVIRFSFEKDYEKLIHLFLNESSLFQILFNMLGYGSNYLRDLIKNDQSKEAVLIQELIIESLMLVDFILSYRIKNKVEFGMTLFEETLMSRLVNYKPLLLCIFEFIDHPYSSESRVLATKVITSFSKLTEQYSPPPSLSGYLGSNATVIIEKCLDRLKRQGESIELRYLILNLISTIKSNQLGLSTLFLSPDNQKAGCIPILEDMIKEGKIFKLVYKSLEIHSKGPRTEPYPMDDPYAVLANSFFINNFKNIDKLFMESLSILFKDLGHLDNQKISVSSLSQFILDEHDSYFDIEKLKRWKNDSKLISMIQSFNQRAFRIQAHIHFISQIENIENCDVQKLVDYLKNPLTKESVLKVAETKFVTNIIKILTKQKSDKIKDLKNISKDLMIATRNQLFIENYSTVKELLYLFLIHSIKIEDSSFFISILKLTQDESVAKICFLLIKKNDVSFYHQELIFLHKILPNYSLLLSIEILEILCFKFSNETPQLINHLCKAQLIPKQNDIYQEKEHALWHRYWLSSLKYISSITNYHSSSLVLGFFKSYQNRFYDVFQWNFGKSLRSLEEIQLVYRFIYSIRTYMDQEELIKIARYSYNRFLLLSQNFEWSSIKPLTSREKKMNEKEELITQGKIFFYDSFRTILCIMRHLSLSYYEDIEKKTRKEILSPKQLDNVLSLIGTFILNLTDADSVNDFQKPFLMRGIFGCLNESVILLLTHLYIYQDSLPERNNRLERFIQNLSIIKGIKKDDILFTENLLLECKEK